MQEKYLLLYEVTKLEYEKELARFTRIEDKAIKLLTVSSIFIVALTAITTNSNVIQTFSESSSTLKMIYCIIILIFFILNIIGLFYVFKCLNITKNYNLPVDKSLFDMINNAQDAAHSYFQVARSYSAYVSENNINNQKKTNSYIISYYILLIAKFSFIAFIIVLSVMLYQSDNNCEKNEWKLSYINNKVTKETAITTNHCKK